MPIYFLFIFLFSCSLINFSNTSNVILKDETVPKYFISYNDPEKFIFRDGNFYDQILRIALVLSVKNEDRSGFGGGGVAIVYNQKKMLSETIDFQTQSFSKVHSHMFHRDGNLVKELACQGKSSIMIPNFIKGLYQIWLEFGTLSWSAIVNPAYEYALNL